MNFKTLSIVLFASFASVSFCVTGCDSQETDMGMDKGPDTEPALTDGPILAIYNQVNSFAIETTALVMERTENADVRALAETIHTDHVGAFAAAEKIAADLDIKMDLPAGRAAAAKEHEDVIAKLSGLSGSDFDQAYVQHEVAFHTVGVAAIKDVLMPAASAPVHKFMTDVLPVCEAHLSSAVELADKLGY